jgi:hypothetical protein
MNHLNPPPITAVVLSDGGLKIQQVLHNFRKHLPLNPVSGFRLCIVRWGRPESLSKRGAVKVLAAVLRGDIPERMISMAW